MFIFGQTHFISVFVRCSFDGSVHRHRPSPSVHTHSSHAGAASMFFGYVFNFQAHFIEIWIHFADVPCPVVRHKPFRNLITTLSGFDARQMRVREGDSDRKRDRNDGNDDSTQQLKITNTFWSTPSGPSREITKRRCGWCENVKKAKRYYLSRHSFAAFFLFQSLFALVCLPFIRSHSSSLVYTPRSALIRVACMCQLGN